MVGSVLTQHEVAKTIVPFVLVEVMNLLSGLEGPAKYPFRDEDML